MVEPSSDKRCPCCGATAYERRPECGAAEVERLRAHLDERTAERDELEEQVRRWEQRFDRWQNWRVFEKGGIGSDLW